MNFVEIVKNKMSIDSFAVCWCKEESSIEWNKEGLKIFVYKWDTGNSYKGYGKSKSNISIVTAETLNEANEIFFKHHSTNDFYDDYYRKDLVFSTHLLKDGLFSNPCLYSYNGEEILKIKHKEKKK